MNSIESIMVKGVVKSVLTEGIFDLEIPGGDITVKNAPAWVQKGEKILISGQLKADNGQIYIETRGAYPEETYSKLQEEI